VRLQRRLVLAEPRVAVHAERRLARRAGELRRDVAQILVEPLEQPVQRLLDVRDVVGAVGAEPLAVIVALQHPQERQRLAREEHRPGHRGRLATCHRG